MTARLSRFGTLLVCGALLGACEQLIGLNDYDEAETAGEDGQGSGAKGGASAQGGKAGSGAAAGTGGSGGAVAGGAGSSSGGSAGGSGKGGGAGKGGSDNGGETSGGAPDVGGSSGANTAGEAGAPSYDCASTVEITDMVLLLPPELDDDSAQYLFGVQSPQIGDFTADEFWVDFYSTARWKGEATGTFDLGKPPDDNYATCARCVWVWQDVGEVSDPVAYFYAKSGTMVVDPASKQMDGFPIISLDKITLIEATIDIGDTNVSRPVENPRCLYLEHAEINLPPPPEEWTCYPEYYGQGDGCDCGCGVIDPDCTGPYGAACELCGGEGACQTDVNCKDIDPENNALCDETFGWVCSTLRYGDEICDCGCGVKDVDCPSSDSMVCDTCEDFYSCTTTALCTEIDPADNSKCVTP